ncbi:MAG: PDZ domain-containing protein [Blastocatellia bacterium]|nr:PDZ domain-containing protein [Blastocatellia bacterium]
MNRSILCVVVLFALAGAGYGQTEATLFREPAVSQTQIAFTYAGDLWIVDRAGGEARRLTSGVGEETSPQFSPNGQTIAFTGQYDGNTDVYTVPVTGGVPKRLTWHPGADTVVGWTVDGKRVLFSSSRTSYSFFPRLFTIGTEGPGIPEEIPLPMAERGSFSPDGAQIAYEPLTQWQPEWKRYRGGQMDYIWIARLSDSAVEALPRKNSNDRYPMWVGDKVYFLSDRDGTYTLYAYDTKTKQVAQAVRNGELDIKSASAGGGAIVYDQFGAIHLFDVKTGRANKVSIRINADLLTLRPRYERVGTRIASGRISPTGARAVFEARGEIVTVPAEKGDPRNLTGTPGVMERYPAWSPDGRWVSYFSDESGEYALHLRDQKGAGEVKKIALDPSFYDGQSWSPDSRKVLLTDKRNNLWYIEVEKGTPVKVDKNPFTPGSISPTWAPDSRWIAYTKQSDNYLHAVWVYSLETGKSHQLTDALSDAQSPAFDKSGKYIYFTASTNRGPGIGFAEMSTFPHQSSRSVYVIVLRNDIPSPLAPESDEEKVTEEKKEPAAPANGAKPEEKPQEKKADAAASAGAAKPPAKKEPDPVRIDLEAIDQRIVALPIPSRNFIDLSAGKANLVYLLEAPPAGAGDFGGPPGFTLHKFDLEKRKFDKAMDGVTSFEISANGEKALIRQGFANWIIAATATLGMPMPPGAGGPGAGPLKVSEMEVYVDPKAEWKQMYHEVWRGHRDFFYAPNAHGLDLQAAEKQYGPYLNAVAHRADFSYLLTEMSNQLTIGHMFIRGGDQPQPNFVPGGLLGADYKIENNRYRLAKVYNGENWNPNARAPLTQPGVNAKAGEYILAINGRNLTGEDNIYQALEGKSGKQVVLRIGPNADGTGARDVTIIPIASETALRGLDWIEGNRRKVDQLSGGKLAYVYVPNTGGGGYTSFNRYFFAQTQKQGAVIDERFNGGGALADYIVEYLSRPLLNFIYFRDGRTMPTPLGAIYGPKAMIVNELAGSGGDALPWYFRKMKIGPTIGKRTWGGLVASQPLPQLMDGGFVTSPDAAIFGLNGEWEVENVGTPADIEVELDPAAWRQGRDPQLEKTVEYLLEEIRKNPQPEYKRPAFPNYHKAPAAGSGN